MFPTVARVLDLDVVTRGLPEVVAGREHLERPVRWVHVSELPDVAGVLQGGELILTTGIALPEHRDGLAQYVKELADVGVAGLVVEFGRRYFDNLPRALVHAAEQRGLPLIVLRRELRFVAVTEAVHALVVNAQLEELRSSEEIHQTFNELAVEGAEPVEVVQQVCRMAGAPVVLENLSHQVLAYDTGGQNAQVLLAGWEARSRGVRPKGRTGHDPRTGWLVTAVGARGHDWGRLVLLGAPSSAQEDVAPAEASHRHTMLLERAAATLALNRLLVRDRESLERQTHRTLLSGILTHALTVSDVALRASALGVPLEGRRLVGVVLRQRRGSAPAALEAQARLRDFTETAAAAVREKRLTALVGALDDEAVGLLVSLGPRDDEHTALEGFASSLRRLVLEAEQPEPVIAVGSSVGAVRDARRTLVEATQVADAALHDAPATGARSASYYRLPDVRLRGLLHLLEGDERVGAFATRELGPLLQRDAATGSRLVQALRHYCEQGGNKSAAAAAAHTSRTAYYQQLARIEQVLGVRLEDPESMLSLYVALLAHDLTRPSEEDSPGRGPQ